MDRVRQEFIRMINVQQQKALNPVEVLEWIRLRMFIKNIPDEIFKVVLEVTMKEMKE